jgi:hypothetical protein
MDAKHTGDHRAEEPATYSSLNSIPHSARETADRPEQIAQGTTVDSRPI